MTAHWPLSLFLHRQDHTLATTAQNCTKLHSPLSLPLMTASRGWIWGRMLREGCSICSFSQCDHVDSILLCFSLFPVCLFGLQRTVAKTHLLGLWSPDSDPDLAGDMVTHIPDTAHVAPPFPLRIKGESAAARVRRKCCAWKAFAILFLDSVFGLSDLWRVGEHENQGCVSSPRNRFKP